MAMWRLLGLMLMLFSVAVRAGVTAVDDTGATVTLAQPAQRIVSLAPHTTELLFAVGAGKQIVGAVDYSDYPEAAKLIPRVGGYSGFDLERVVMLKPDLVVAWRSGNADAAVEKLQQLGLKVYLSEPRALDDVATNLERLAILTGHVSAGQQAVADYRGELKRLQQRYAGATKVRLFYQIWNSPLMTINGQHLIGRVINLCGGQNIFASLPTLAPQVDLEAVLVANPEAIIASGMGYERPEWLDEWQRWPELAAVKSGTIFVIHPDIINRHSPRILKGAAQMCDQLQAVRARRK
ncbi:MAG: cobalamin-binding protein [Pseudomonadota bacterium]|nr:cobalamin-binding protein [Pseudomonadota bacterium]